MTVQVLTSAASATPSSVVAAHGTPAALLTRPQLETWLRKAAPGDRITYHRGYLALDRVAGSRELPEPARRDLVAVASLALALAARGEIHLLQQRIKPGIFEYFAVRGHPARGLGIRWMTTLRLGLKPP